MQGIMLPGLIFQVLGLKFHTKLFIVWATVVQGIIAKKRPDLELYNYMFNFLGDPL